MRKTLRAPTTQSDPAGSLKAFGMALGIFYIAGYWAYIVWFVWEYWSRDLSYGPLVWNGAWRAIIWPVWVALALV